MTRLALAHGYYGGKGRGVAAGTVLVDATSADTWDEFTKTDITATKTTDSAETFNGKATTRIDVTAVTGAPKTMSLGKTSGVVVPSGPLLPGVWIKSSVTGTSGLRTVTHNIGNSDWSTYYYTAIYMPWVGYPVEEKPPQDEWWFFPLVPALSTPTGAPSAALTTRYRLSLVLGGACSVWVSDVVLYNPGRPRCVLFLDDGLASAYSFAFSECQTYDVPLTLAVWTDGLDTAGQLTSAQAAEIIGTDGFEIVNHGKRYEDFSSAPYNSSVTAYVEDVLAARTVLAGLGASAASQKLFVYPNGVGTRALVASLRANGFTAARAVNSSGNVVTDPYASGAYRFWLMRSALLETGAESSAALAQAQIAKVMKNGGTAFLIGHDLVSGAPGGGELAESEFTALLSWLSARRNEGTLDLLLFSEWAATLSGARLDASTGRVTA